MITGLEGTVFTTRATEGVDDSDRLVAYRLNFLNKASMTWVINYNGKVIGYIKREDSKWVHDNWSHSFNTDDAVRKSFLTRENRGEWDRILRSLTFDIRRAFKARTADVVVATLKTEV